MSHTYRRRGQHFEYRWVLRDYKVTTPAVRARGLLDLRSKEGRRAVARFHSDAECTMRGGAPRWFRRIFKCRLRNANTVELRRWLADPAYDPVLQTQHRHSANWAWW